MKNSTERLPIETILSRVDGDLDFLKEMARVFIGELPSVLTELSQAFSEKKAAELERLAHKLKSSLYAFGLSETAQLAHQIEKSAQAVDWKNLDIVFLELKKCLEALQPEFQRLLDYQG